MHEKIKTLKTIHLAICIGVIFVYLFAGNITMATLNIPKIDSTSIFYLLLPILAIVISHFLFQSQLKKLDPKLKLEENTTVYLTVSLIRWVVLEGTALIVLFAMPEYTLLGIILIMYLIFLRPTEESIKRDLQYVD